MITLKIEGEAKAFVLRAINHITIQADFIRGGIEETAGGDGEVEES